MYFPEDEKIAKYLQNEFDYLQEKEIQISESTEKENHNPVDSILEISDPTPSIHDLFVKFDKKFFWNSLGMVQVLWSDRMTTCAGMCRFEGKFGLCKISLSAPLLSFRPRKDLVQTLLHEMIHAYLFVTNNFKDRNDHGTEFHRHMFRINNEAGTNITVYHSFHDEVNYYKQHIWRCNGPCKFKKPYFGFVKRAQNRAPGPNDYWWSKHESECNGTFIKVAEPEKKIKKLKNPKITKVEMKTKDIRNFVQQVPNLEKKSNIVTLADLSKTTSTALKSGTITVINKISNGNSEKTNTLIGKKDNNLESNFPKCNNSKSPNKSSKKNKKINNVDIPDSVLEKYFSNNKCSSSKNTNENEKTINSEKIKETVRNIWCNKFLPKLSEEKIEIKKIKLECSVSDNEPKNEIKNHSDLSLNQKETKNELKSFVNELKYCPICNEKILKSEMNEHLENCVNCSFVNINNLNDNDNCNDDDDNFDEVDEYENVLELEKQSNEVTYIPQNEKNEINCDLVSCPCCNMRYLESKINSHLDECLTLIAFKDKTGDFQF